MCYVTFRSFAICQCNYSLLKGTSGSIAVCISPLQSLMMDQCAKFALRGLQVEIVGEAQTDPTAKGRVISGEVQLVFITPESVISTPVYRKMLVSAVYREKLVALVIDEAHCVKTWGDQFRPTFAQIGDLRSLIPSTVNVMALTATATSETFDVVRYRLSMDKPTLIALPPHSNSIKYQVSSKIGVDDFTTSLCREFASKRTSFPKTVIYVRTYSDCSSIYMLLKHKMGSSFTEPPGYPNLSDFRLVDMFTAVLTAEKKEQVLQSFAKSDGKLRLIVATTAFGMGVDCPDIRRIVHWGMSSTLEEYVQETGRSGRDGKSSVAVLYQGIGGRNATKTVKDYVSNTTVCRRRLLFQGFLMFSESDIHVSGCKCCDVCEKLCTCALCS